MLGLVITLVAAAAPALPAATATCGDAPDTCELAPAPVVQRDEPAYATPAVIDCRLPVVPAVLSTLVGECIGTPQPHDASYRASRYPEGEDSASLSPVAGRDSRGGRASCDGLPREAPRLTLTHVQPLALYATPVFVRVGRPARGPADALQPPSRFADPPDRPPRV